MAKDAPFTFHHILTIVTSFYEKATRDVFIGYHFRHIENFDTHIPRIAGFWELQILGTCQHPDGPPYDLVKVHLPLQMKKAQVRRWVILFMETLDEAEERIQSESVESSAGPAHVLTREHLLYLQTWREKIRHFEEKFLNHRIFFPVVPS